jgi:hypothetical protein
MSCPSENRCAAGGTYMNGTTTSQGFVINQI